MQQSLGAHAKIHLAAAAVNQKAHADKLAAVLLNDLHNLFHAAAGSNDILYHQHTGACRDLKATTQCHLAVFTLSEDGAGAQGLAHLMRQQDTAGHRADNQLHVVIFIAACDFLAQALGVFGMLQHVKFFYVHGAVQAAGQQKVTVQHCLGFLQHL